MSSRGYKVTSFIVCDDVRREASGKYTIIGVYSKIIIVRSFPAQLPQITFQITCDLDRADFENVKLVVLDTDNTKMVEANGKIKIGNVDEPINIAIAFLTPVFHKAGTYTVRMGLDSNPRKIGEFIVRLAESKTERERLGLTEQSA